MKATRVGVGLTLIAAVSASCLGGQTPTPEIIYVTAAPTATLPMTLAPTAGSDPSVVSLPSLSVTPSPVPSVELPDITPEPTLTFGKTLTTRVIACVSAPNTDADGRTVWEVLTGFDLGLRNAGTYDRQLWIRTTPVDSFEQVKPLSDASWDVSFSFTVGSARIIPGPLIPGDRSADINWSMDLETPFATTYVVDISDGPEPNRFDPAPAIHPLMTWTEDVSLSGCH